MYNHRTHTKAAKITLMLVGWVIAICFMQNSALVTACQYQGLMQESPTTAFVDGTNNPTQEDAVGKPCDLTSKLFGSAKVNLEHLMVPLTLIALLIVAWISQLRPTYVSFTEPIVPKNRVHLTLCVFRE